MSPADPAWAERDAALAAYRAVLPERMRASCASSVIHMHVNRLLGQADLEPLVRALAGDLLFSQVPASDRPAT
jgi:lantibiotic biosynthesis protein